MERRFREFNMNLRSPLEEVARGLLNHHRPLSMVEGDDPTLPAFMNALLDMNAQLNTSFILREYNDPNAFRPEEEEIEELTAGEHTGEAGKEQNANNATFATTDKEDAEASDFPSIEETHRTDDNFEMSLVDLPPGSPGYDSNNLADGIISLADPLSQEITSVDIASGNMWGFMDSFSDNIGDFVTTQSANTSEFISIN